MSTTVSTVSNAVYQFEYVKSGVSAGVLTFIAILMLIFAIVMFRDSKTAKVTATVASSNCFTGSIGKHETTTHCNLTLNYTVAGKQYTTPLTTTGLHYHDGQQITVNYDPKNPNLIELRSMNPRTIGMLLAGFALLFLILGWGYFYLVRKYPSFGTAMGYYDSAKILTNVI